MQCSRETVFLLALLATPTSPVAMADQDEKESEPLSDELAAALRRATDQTLVALHSLRVALRDHVQRERASGATLAEIDSGLTEMIEHAMHSDGDGDGHSPERISELRIQVLKWSESFYSRRGKQ